MSNNVGASGAHACGQRHLALRLLRIEYGGVTVPLKAHVERLQEVEQAPFEWPHGRRPISFTHKLSHQGHCRVKR
jgi:hypothetical protein